MTPVFGIGIGMVTEWWFFSISKMSMSEKWWYLSMTEIADRRIQLKESVHTLVATAARARGVSPAALVSVVLYEYLRERGELQAQPAPAATPAPAEPAQPVVKSPPLSHWPNLTRADLLANGYSEAEADEALGVKPTTVQDVIADWPDDD